MSKTATKTNHTHDIAPIGVPSVESLMALAIQHDRIDQMKELVALRERIQAEAAREAFARAMSEFQAELPIIAAKNAVMKDGKVRYRYADLADISKIIGPIAKKCGLSWRFNAPYNKETQAIEASCIVSHVGGHYEKFAPFSVPLDPDAFMTNQQRYGSANSYARRYALCNALGIVTEDQDDDASQGEQVQTANKMYADFRKLMDAVLRNAAQIIEIKKCIEQNDIQEAVKLMHEIEDEDRLTLWRSPSKGGPWTTAERTLMRGNEWLSVWQTLT